MHSTITAQGSAVLPSSVLSTTVGPVSSPGANSSIPPMRSPTGATYTPGSIYANSTGTSDVSWQAGTSISVRRGSPQTVSTPDSVAASGVTGSTGRGRWNSTQTINTPGLATSVVAPSRFRPSEAAVGPTEPSPTSSSNWNLSRTASASFGVSSPEFTTSVVTGDSLGPIHSISGFPQTVGAPFSFVSSSNIAGFTGSLSETRISSQEIATPTRVISPDITTSPTGPTSHSPFEGPPGGNIPGSSEVGGDASGPFPIPSPFTPAKDTASGQGATKSSSPAAGGSPSFPYDPPSRRPRKRSSPSFIQERVVHDSLAQFSFPEKTSGPYERLWLSSQGALMADIALTSTSDGMNPASHSPALGLTQCYSRQPGVVKLVAH